MPRTDAAREAHGLLRSMLLLWALRGMFSSDFTQMCLHSLQILKGSQSLFGRFHGGCGPLGRKNGFFILVIVRKRLGSIHGRINL